MTAEHKDQRSYDASPDPDEKDKRDDQDRPGGESGGKKKKKPKRRRVLALTIAAVVGVVLAVLTIFWWLSARRFESTDDAFVDTNITHVAPRAAGQVMQVFVTDNQPVRAGQLLVQLDDSTAHTQLAQGEAAKQQALSLIAQAAAQVQVASGQLEQAQVNTRAPAAQAANAARDYRRFKAVQSMAAAAVAQQQVDQAQTTSQTSAAQYASALKQVKTSQAQVAAARTQLGVGQAQLQAAEAQMAQARLQINYARVVATVDGHVSHKTVAVGDYAQPGQVLLSVVPRDLWVTANFKETQLKLMRPGQDVDLRVDAYPNVHFHGRVDSIQRGAGQSFQVLPAQNATGNYVKVVQRVPVKIVINRPDQEHPLGPGMSVEPKVKVRP